MTKSNLIAGVGVWRSPEIGGTAFKGKVEGEKYFVLNHGQYNAIPRGAFRNSKIHG